MKRYLGTLSILAVVLLLKLHASSTVSAPERSEAKRERASDRASAPAQIPSVLAAGDKAVLPAAPRKSLDNRELTSESLLHPSVKYDHPEAIRSFSDPKLQAVFEVYFSLVGEAAVRHPYAGSAFDTEHNSELAFVKLSERSERLHSPFVRDESTADFLALTHLTQSGLESSKKRVDSLAEQWLGHIETSKNPTHRSLLALDSEPLVTDLATRRPEQVVHRYHASQDRLVQSTLALGLMRSLVRQGNSEQEAIEQLAAQGMRIPDLQGAKLVSFQKEKR